MHCVYFVSLLLYLWKGTAPFEDVTAFENPRRTNPNMHAFGLKQKETAKLFQAGHQAQTGAAASRPVANHRLTAVPS